MFSLLARKPWYLLVLPLAVLLAVLGYRSGGLLLVQGDAGAAGAELADALGKRTPSLVVAPAAAQAPLEQGAGNAVAPGFPVDLRAAFESGQDLFRYSRQLQAAAEAGDAEAGWVVSRIYDYCGVYAMDPAGYALDSNTLARMGLSDVPGLTAAREQVSAGCAGFTAADALGRGKVLQQRRMAASSGNLAAEAALLSMGEPLKDDPAYRRELVERVLHSQDPEAFLAVSPAMGVAAAGDEAYTGLVAGDQFAQLAWQVAACQLGMACGPSSKLMISYCANGGICSRVPGQDFETFVFDAAVPQQGVKKMNQLVSSLRAPQGGKP